MTIDNKTKNDVHSIGYPEFHYLSFLNERGHISLEMCMQISI